MTGLTGLRILVVEDEIIIAMDIAAVLSDAGAQILGPAPSVEKALTLLAASELDCAVLDMRLGKTEVWPVAEALADRGIPFIFHSGHGRRAVLDSRWKNCIVVEKPSPDAVLLNSLRTALLLKVQ